MATAQQARQKWRAALIKIDGMILEYKKEMSRLRKERLKIIETIEKKADDQKIQDILKKIR